MSSSLPLHAIRAMCHHTAMKRSLNLIFVFALASSLTGLARAIVGAGHPSSHAANVVMVLNRAGAQAGFCSGSVIGARTVLTAAHCVTNAADTRVYFKDANGAAVLAPVARVTIHPGYRRNAAAARARSIDLAVVETQDALPANFSPVSTAPGENDPGAHFALSGFGLTQEGAPSSGGTLRDIDLTLTQPVSALLLWLVGPDSNSGACTGDSGGPVFGGDGSLVAIAAFAEGAGGRHCGKLTQAVRLAPFQDWIGALRK